MPPGLRKGQSRARVAGQASASSADLSQIQVLSQG